jgi:hypothetical protein
MATAMTDRQCDVCHHRHTFCEPTSDQLAKGVSYDYVCPTTGIMGRVAPGEVWPDVGEECPVAAVIVWPAGSTGFGSGVNPR